MKVKDLIQQLEKFDVDIEVCIFEKGGHGEPDFPTEIKVISVGNEQFCDGKFRKIIIIKT